MEVWSSLLSHRIPVPALKWINYPAYRIAAFDIQLEFLRQLMFKFHLYQFGSSDLLLQRFLGCKCKVMIFLLHSFCWALTGTTHQRRIWPEPIDARWMVPMLSQLLLIVSDVLPLLLAGLSLFLYLKAMKISWLFTSPYLTSSSNWKIAITMWLRYLFVAPIT